MTARIIDGRSIAQGIKKQVFKEVINLISIYKKPPNIATVIIGEDEASKLYLKLRYESCKEVGINTCTVEHPGTVSQREVVDSIRELNENEDVHGILLQFPIPKHLSPSYLVSLINPVKDVEGIHPLNMGKIMIGDEDIIPCTPLAVLTILNHERINIEGKNVVIVNHSMIVGKPLSILLLNRNATVSTCHVYTKDLKRYTTEADILITAAGTPRLITKDHIKNNACVIDVSVINTKDGVCGDVDENVKEKASLLTPVPGGVGPVTIACSLQNMVKTYRKQMEEKTKKDK